MLLVVGGHSRNVGKTSVVAGLIRALPEAGWTAVKITQFGHGVCASAGKACHCGTELEHPYAIAEEIRPSDTDTGRFLAAGARRSYWVRTAQGNLAPALPALRKLFEAARNVIVESNSLLQFVRPDLYLLVADASKADFKDSARRFLDRADALVMVERQGGTPDWTGVSPALWSAKPRFPVHPPGYESPEAAAFVRARLALSP